jgi:EamA domain-containing membrane protein RarD
LYPVATVLLGRLLLAERLTVVQQAGVGCALAGVVLLSVA